MFIKFSIVVLIVCAVILYFKRGGNSAMTLFDGMPKRILVFLFAGFLVGLLFSHPFKGAGIGVMLGFIMSAVNGVKVVNNSGAADEFSDTLNKTKETLYNIRWGETSTSQPTQCIEPQPEIKTQPQPQPINFESDPIDVQVREVKERKAYTDEEMLAIAKGLNLDITQPKDEIAKQLITSGAYKREDYPDLESLSDWEFCKTTWCRLGA